MWRHFTSRRTPAATTTQLSEGNSVKELLYDVLGQARRPSGRHTDLRWLEPAIERLRREAAQVDPSRRAAYLQALLVVQAPRAARAQMQMDTHRHAYHNREKRLFELIDFNDTFVDAVLALPKQDLPSFETTIREHMRWFCNQARAEMFDDEQLDAIIRGLSREIALYFGAKQCGYEVQMTSRVDDAFGIDMVISDPSQGTSVNVDCKTPSAFRYRMEDLLHEGRIDETQLLEADRIDYVHIENRHDNERVPVTILCLRPERLGNIQNFAFTRTAPLEELLRRIM